MKLSVGKVLVGASLPMFLLACGPTIKTGRIGRPIPLPTGAAQSACEGREWLELAPTRVIAEGAVSQGLRSVYYSQVREGLGLFRPGADELLEIPDELPRFDETELQQKHMAPIERVESASDRALVWSLVGLAGLGAGLGVAAGVYKDNPELAAGAGLGGLAVGLVGAIISLIEQPSGEQQLEASARERLFEDPDDMRAVIRGTYHANAKQRIACGGSDPGPLTDTFWAQLSGEPTEKKTAPAPAVEDVWRGTPSQPSATQTQAAPPAGAPPPSPKTDTLPAPETVPETDTPAAPETAPATAEPGATQPTDSPESPSSPQPEAPAP